MKKTGIFMVAIAAMLSVGVASCSKDDNNSRNGENNDGGGSATIEWVDLGLPSGLLWAKCNLGATAPEEYGNYYAWGEVQSKEVYTWGTYHYCTAVDNYLIALSKYNTSNDFGTPDYMVTLQDEDDAAIVAIGNGARIPTKTEWEELIANTTVEWATQNGVNGCKFTGSNGKVLFLPASGHREGSELKFVGSSVKYWSSSLYVSNPRQAYYFFSSVTPYDLSHTYRMYGCSVRPVRSAQ